jgi:putative FmdB family regulatory protein
MPLFEYECRDCGKPFEAFVTAERTPSCPACQGVNLERLLSSPGMVGVGNGRSTGSAPSDVPMCAARGGRCGCAH